MKVWVNSEVLYAEPLNNNFNVIKELNDEVETYLEGA